MSKRNAVKEISGWLEHKTVGDKEAHYYHCYAWMKKWKKCQGELRRKNESYDICGLYDGMGEGCPRRQWVSW